MKNSKKKSLWGTLAIVGIFLVGKMKWVLALLKLAKLQTLISMLIYLGTYALFYGWSFAVALVYLLFVHEMGHLYAAKKIKLPTSPAIFIPFMGAAIGMKERPKNAKDEGFLAYMGPVFGLLSFLPAIPLYYFTHEPFWALLIVFGSMINLFNLIPLSPLDGGRIVAGISTKLWGVGLVLLLAFAIWSKSIVAFLVLIMGIFQLISVHKEQKNISKKQQEVAEYEQTLSTLKTMVNTSSYEDLLFFAYSLREKIEAIGLLESILLLKSPNLSVSTEEEIKATEAKQQENTRAFIESFEKEVLRLKAETAQIAAYYKTDTKTKVKLFAIYVGLILVLGASFYFSFDLLPPL